MAIKFVTSNEGKVREAREYLSGLSTVEQVTYAYTEIQSEELHDIAAHGARETYEAIESDDGILVGDSGLFIDILDGFPGPYSSYVESTLGIDRVWQLASDASNKRARFQTVLAFADENGVETFSGEVAGTIVEPRGSGGFGYDPIFEYNGQTFAEMSIAEKNAISHRGRALATFIEWYSENRQDT